MRMFRGLRAISFSVAAVLAASAPAWAEEGLPQLDTSLYPEQLFWLVVTFGILYVAMSVVALPRVAKTKDNRQHVIAGELSAAKEASDSAKAAVIAVEKSLAAARAKAQATVSEMIAEVSADAAARQTAQERELSRRLHSAEADIAVTREAALKNVRDTALDLASGIVEKVVGAKLRVTS